MAAPCGSSEATGRPSQVRSSGGLAGRACSTMASSARAYPIMARCGRPVEPSAVAVLWRRVGAANDLVGEGPGCLPEQPGYVRVPLGELGDARRQASHVLPDEHLGVAVRPGPDPDGGDRQ